MEREQGTGEGKEMRRVSKRVEERKEERKETRFQFLGR